MLHSALLFFSPAYSPLFRRKRGNIAPISPFLPCSFDLTSSTIAVRQKAEALSVPLFFRKKGVIPMKWIGTVLLALAILIALFYIFVLLAAWL